MKKTTRLRTGACALLAGGALLAGTPALAQQQILVNSQAAVNRPNRPFNITRAVTNLINGTATMEGVIASVGSNYFVIMTYNKFNLVYFTPSTTSLVMMPGAHIVATVLPVNTGAAASGPATVAPSSVSTLASATVTKSNASTNSIQMYTLQKINQYDGADASQGIASPTPPAKPSGIPQMPVYETTTLPGPVPLPVPAIPGITAP